MKMQTFAWLLGLWIGWVGHHATGAAVPYTDLGQKNNFFHENERSTLHFGIKSWFKGTKRIIEKRWAIGSEIAIGPFVEWHFCNSIGLQTGLFYSYNLFFSLDFCFRHKRPLDTSLFSSYALSYQDGDYIAYAGLVNVQFHAISLPLFFRLYPEKSRKWVCYGGPRFILMLPGLKKKQSYPLYVDTSVIKNIFYDALKRVNDMALQRRLTAQDIQDIVKHGLDKVYDSIFEFKTGRVQCTSNKLFNWNVVWDFGFEFRGRSGMVIGINGLGLVLGYDYAK